AEYDQAHDRLEKVEGVQKYGRRNDHHQHDWNANEHDQHQGADLQHDAACWARHGQLATCMMFDAMRLTFSLLNAFSSILISTSRRRMSGAARPSRCARNWSARPVS